MPPAVASVFSLLLVITGAAKLRRPEETARAIGQMGVPFSKPLTVLLGASEVFVGVFALLTRQPVALLIQASLYVLFLIWIALAMRLDVPLTSCGCLGRTDTPPFWGHVVLNAIGVAASLAAAVLTPSISSSDGVAFLADLTVTLVGVGLAWAILDIGSRANALVNQ